ncbi:MAG: FHA domain-containing protein, partial [Planctomycetota bacterium]
MVLGARRSRVYYLPYVISSWNADFVADRLSAECYSFLWGDPVGAKDLPAKLRTGQSCARGKAVHGAKRCTGQSGAESSRRRLTESSSVADNRRCDDARRRTLPQLVLSYKLSGVAMLANARAEQGVQQSWLEHLPTGGGAIQRTSLDAAETTIGRAETADLQIDSTRVSRAHAKIQPCAGGYEILDLGSTNGTFVNGRQIE